jgi:molybdopterin-containing oxidoreductase family membrane subunit
MAEHSEQPPKNYIGPTDMWVFPNAAEITEDVAGKTRSMPSRYKLALGISGVLAVLGIIGFVMRLTMDGFAEHGPWGYYAAVFSFIFLITGSAPLFAIAFRITKNHWRRPVSRIAELFAVLGVLNVILYIPLIYALPPIANPTFGPDSHGELVIRRTIWMEVPIGAPHWWNLLGIVALAVTSLAILWVSAAPDMAEARPHSGNPGAGGFRGSLYRMLSGHWFGTKKQWFYQKASLAILGALYFMMLIFVQFLIVSDFAMSLIPGWKDAILPPLYTITGFQSAISLVLIIAFVMRRWGRYEQYIGISPFWSASKVQLGLTLLWTYHLFAFFITMWYGRLEVEQNLIKYLIFESYTGIFWANVFLIFFIPFFMLIWNPLRKSDWGPALAGLFILCGNLMFQIRMFVGAFNAGDIYDLGLSRVPPPVFPDIWDLFIVIGGIGLAAFIYLVAAKALPLISLWEVKEGALYQRKDRLFRGEYLVLAKPE